jgi:hypothetical protein
VVLQWSSLSLKLFLGFENFCGVCELCGFVGFVALVSVSRRLGVA